MGWLSCSILFLALLLGGVLHAPMVQDWIARKASDWLSSYIECGVSIEKLDFSLIKRQVRISGIEVSDSRGNPTLQVGQAIAVLKNYDFQTPTLTSVSLLDPCVDICRYEGDSMSDFKRVLHKIQSRPKKDTAERKAFMIESMRIENGSLTYHAQDEPEKPDGQIDFKHVSLKGIDAEASDFFTRNGRVIAKLKHLEGTESKGLRIDGFSSWIYVDKGQLRFIRTRLRTPGTQLSLDLSLLADNWKQYAGFVDNVKIQADIRSSQLSLEDLARFAYALKGMDQHIGCKGHVNGPVSDIRLEDFSANLGDSAVLSGDFHLKGLPDIRDAEMELDLKELYVSRTSLEGFRLPGGKVLNLPQVLSSLQYLRSKGVFTGRLDRFSSNLMLNTNLADLSLVSMVIDSLDNGNGGMSGNVVLSDVHAGRLLKSDILRKFDLQAGFVLTGTGFQDVGVELDGEIDNILIGKNILKPLAFRFTKADSSLSAWLECFDPGLDFTLHGTYFQKGETESDLDLDLRKINLQPLHLMGDTGACSLTSQVYFSHSGRDLASFEGCLRMQEIGFERLGRHMYSDSLLLSLKRIDSVDKSLLVRSSFVDVDYTGGWKLSEVWQTIRYTFLSYFPDAEGYFSDDKDRGHGGRSGKGRNGSSQQSRTTDIQHLKRPGNLVDRNFDLGLKVKDADTLLPLLFPGIEMPFGMTLSANYSALGNTMVSEMKLPYFQKGRMALVKTHLDLEAGKDRVGLSLGMDHLYLSDSVEFRDFHLAMERNDTNSLAYRLEWAGEDSLESRSTVASFTGQVKFLPQSMLRMDVGESFYKVGNILWRNYLQGSMMFSKGFLSFENFGMYASDYSGGILLAGELSHRENSVLRIDFDNFSLSYFDFLLAKSGMAISASLNGYAEVHDFYSRFLFDADLSFDNFSINGQSYGRAVLSSNFSRKDAVKAMFEIQSDSSHKCLHLDGIYYPLREHKLDFQGYADKLDMAFLKGYLSTLMKDLQGSLSGNLKVGGSLKDLQLWADVVASDMEATIPVIETRYRFDRFPLLLTSRKIILRSSRFKDVVYNTTGNFGGEILHQNFKDMKVDLNATFDNVLAFNASKNLSLPFWGTVFASGRMTIKGPTNAIHMSVSANIENNSDLAFDFSAPGGANGANFITFRTPQVRDTVVSLDRLYANRRGNGGRRPGNEGKGLSMDLNLNVTPGLDVSLGIKNPAMSGQLQAKGSGLLRISMGEGDPKLFGTYTVSEGEFDFSMVDLINKRFVLEEGGTLSWIGPMLDARVNIRASYPTKASLYPVLASLSMDEEDARQYKQNVNVNSVILISGNLMSPDIGFEIDLANVDDDTRDKFFAVVKKDDEDEMLRQTFSLLMFNSFMSVEGGASGVGSSALASSSDLLFSQFNNFLSKFTNDFNIGVNYKPRDQVSNSEFQVMMSGQLFDDRLIINGNLGVSDNTTGASPNAGASTVVGDVDIEWKFTEELRLRGFNHSNDQDLTKPANSYTQGVGIVFKRDFDNFKEFLYGSNPKTRAERKAEREKNREIRKARRENRRK